MNPAKTLNDIGVALWSCGDLEGAQVQFEQLLDLARCQECEALQATAWNNLAVVFREQGESARAAVCQQQAWQAGFGDNSADSQNALSQNLTNRANDAILAGDYTLAERLLNVALEVDVRAGNCADEAADWGSLGIVALLTGQFDQARHCFSMASQIHKRLGDDRCLGCDLGHLGQLSLAEQDWPAARSFIEQSVRCFERAGCKDHARLARANLREIGAYLRIACFDPVRN
jgi:tetratricopeptide (TPR) repeat protein